MIVRVMGRDRDGIPAANEALRQPRPTLWRHTRVIIGGWRRCLIWDSPEVSKTCFSPRFPASYKPEINHSTPYYFLLR